MTSLNTIQNLNLISVSIWLLSYSLIYLKKEKVAAFIFSLPILTLLTNIILLWIQLERPPMRTLGETRLWYSFLLPIFGLLMALKLKKTWIMIYTSSMAILFLLLNYFNPDNFDKTLMPALQSPWFIPHVIVYMVAYALLGATSIYSFKRIISYKFEKFNNSLMNMNEIDNFVYTGFSFLTLGLIFGALWAKEAWGDYWAWDPKETWALITWLFYLSYLHLNRKNAKDSKLSAFFLAFGFIILLICWFGINYMPTAKNSVHTYTFEN